MKQLILDILKDHPDGKGLKKSQLQRRCCEKKGDEELFIRSINDLIREATIQKNPGGSYTLSTLEQKTGKLALSAGGYGFITPDDDSETIFVPPGQNGAAVNNEIVQVLITDRDARGRKGPVGRVTKIIESKLTALSGELEFRQGQPWLIPLRSGIPAVELSIESVDASLKAGDWIRATVVSRDTQSGRITASLSDVLGNADNLTAELDAIIDEYELEHEYSDEQEEAATKMRPRKIERRDLTKELITTIDPRDAKDFDDALSIHPTKNKNHITIGIHIADVAAYIAPRSKLMEDIRKRCFTAYLPGRMVPMLPKVLVKKRCSLTENEVKPAHTVMITFDKITGAFISSERFHSTIKVSKRLNYEEVQDYADDDFKGDPWGKEVSRDVRTLFEFSLILRKYREDHEHFIPLEAPEVRVLCDPLTMNITGLKKDSPSNSKQMVEEYMLAANTAVATELVSKAVPGMYRIHPEPDDEQAAGFSANMMTFYGINTGDLCNRKNAIHFLGKIKGHPSAPVISMDFLRTMQRASYSSMKGLHYGLGKNLYSHFTSPIRRLSDLMVHQQLWALEDKGNPIYSKQKMEDTAELITNKESSVDEAYRTAINRFKMHYVQQMLDSNEKLKADALIIKIAAKRMRLFLPEYGMYSSIAFKDLNKDYFIADIDRGEVRGKESGLTWNCGDTLEVMITGADFNMREFIIRPLFSAPERREKNRNQDKRRERKERRKQARTDLPERTPFPSEVASTDKKKSKKDDFVAYDSVEDFVRGKKSDKNPEASPEDEDKKPKFYEGHRKFRKKDGSKHWQPSRKKSSRKKKK